MDRSIIAENRRQLGAVQSWIDDQAYANSRAYYGVPPRRRRYVDLPIDEGPTCSDVLVAAARALKPGLSYLEVGVSLGKNLWLMCNALSNAHLVGFDWERINPRLASHLEFVDQSGPVRRYGYGQNRVTYVEGDLFRPEDWRPLEGLRFSLLFLDAIKSPQAMRFLLSLLVEKRLLDERRFFLLWGELDASDEGPMSATFAEVAAHLTELSPHAPVRRYRLMVNGSHGQHEPARLLGVLTNTGLTPEDLL